MFEIPSYGPHGKEGAANKMDDYLSDFLPDLNTRKTSEQLVFESEVYNANQQFVRIQTDMIKWILSPPESRVYPQHAKNNKCAF